MSLGQSLTNVTLGSTEGETTEKVDDLGQNAGELTAFVVNVIRCARQLSASPRSVVLPLSAAYFVQPQ